MTGVTDSAATARNASYSYSDAGRVTAATGPWGSDSYAYDANGNRLSATRTIGTASASDVATIAATSNRLTRVRDAQGTLAKSYSYDGAGETISQVKAGGPTLAYSYDARGRMASVSSNGTQLVANLYDHAGRRVSRAQGSGIGALTVHYLFDDAGQLLAEHDGSTGALLREYIWLGGMLVAMVDGPVAAPVYTYVHTGHLDEPILTTNAAKQVTSSITRDPFGNAIMLSGSAQIALGYPGQWHDQSAGLYQNWNRDYDPSTGRYLETDPIGLAGGTNLYAYTDGNPVNAVDPRGEIAWWVVGGLLGGGGNLLYQLHMNDGRLECVDWSEVGGWALTGAGASGLVRSGAGRLAQSETLFGRHKVGLLNSNDILRVGWSWKGSAQKGRDVFRLALGNRRWPKIPGLPKFPWHFP